MTRPTTPTWPRWGKQVPEVDVVVVIHHVRGRDPKFEKGVMIERPDQQDQEAAA